MKKKTIIRNLAFAFVLMVVLAILFRSVFGWHVFLFLFPVPLFFLWRRGDGEKDA